MANCPNRAQLLATAQAFLNSYGVWNRDAILSVRSAKCVHRTLPTSPVFPPADNSSYGALLERVIPRMSRFELYVVDERETAVDTERRKVVMHVRSRAESDMGPYENEYTFTLTMNEDGQLVDEVVEFLDSAYSATFFAKLFEQEPK